MNRKGFLDLGLALFMGASVIFGAIVVNDLTKDQTAENLCKKQGSVQIGDSLYQCKKTATLGQTIIVKVPVVKPCAKCKPVQKPCGDDKKIFPMCEGLR